MWLNSKKAAEILGIKYDTLQKSINRANKTNKKFCSIKCNILPFKYTDGVGRGGKTLQIWIDDANLSGGNSVSGNPVGGDMVVGGNSVGGNSVSSDTASGDMVSNNHITTDWVTTD